MAQTHQHVNIGSLKRLKILCISETGWFDNATLAGDVKAAGGMRVSQYTLPCIFPRVFTRRDLI